LQAIRIRALGRYFGPRIETDGAARPREAWRSLLRIAGITLKPADDDLQVTFAVAGHVLRDISLDIEEGSVVCLTGPSGSGKTVLLQILAGVVPPTSGSVEMYGSVTSLLSIGDNLHPRLTAVENIQAAAEAGGIAPEDRARYAAEIIAFAELEGSEDVALRTYSTGMLLRLSIALALCGRPSIVLIDDVLGVGDIAFQQKCVDRLHALKEAGTTLVLAFSDDALVQQLATRIVTLGSGRIVADTPPRHWATASPTSRVAAVDWQVLDNLPENDVTALRRVEVRAGGADEDAYLDIGAAFDAKIDGLQCRPLVAVAASGTLLFRSLYPDFVPVAKARRLTFTVRVPTQVLPNGTYAIGLNMVAMRGKAVYSLKASEAITLTVRRDTDATGVGPRPPMLALQFPWEIERVVEAPS
jgi:ABC-type polysaccharide/polyol phosphate transport system ATPase subunit